jgi:hypothetical protein
MTGRRMEYFRSGTNREKKKKRHIYPWCAIYFQSTGHRWYRDTARIDVAGGVRALVAPVPQGSEVKGFLVDRPSRPKKASE